MDILVTKMKLCGSCKIEKELSEFYSMNKKYADGTPYTYYRPDCKDCTKEKAKDWIANNPEKYKQSKKKYDLKKEAKELRKIRDIEYRESGKSLEWQRRNKDKIKQYIEHRKFNKKHEISKDEWIACKNYFNHECAYCGLHVDEHFKSFRGELRKMDLHKEHVIHDGSNDLSNCVPACQSCNSSKITKSLEEWYTDYHNFYSKDRLYKIYKWLNEDYKLYIKF